MEQLLHAFEILILLSFPQMFCVNLFVLTFLDIKVRYGRLTLYTAALSILQNISFTFIGNPVHIPISIALNALLLSLFYSALERRTRLLALGTTIVAVMLSDLLSISIAELVLSYETMMNGPVYYKMVAWPSFLILLAAALGLRRKRHLRASRLVLLVNETKDSAIIAFILLVASELVLLSVYLIFYRILEQHRYETVAFNLGLIAIVAVTAMCGRLILQARQSAIEKARSVFVDELLQLFATAKGQRHDFVNHVQTMYTMLQLGKHAQLRDYMRDIAEDVQDLAEQSNALVLPALAALLQAKSAFAADQRIRFDVSIPELPVERLAVEPFELVSVTRSMMELAFDQILHMPSNRRRLAFDARCSHGELVIRVTAYHAGGALPVAGRDRHGPELALMRRHALSCNASFAYRPARDADAYELHVPLSGAV